MNNRLIKIKLLLILAVIFMEGCSSFTFHNDNDDAVCDKKTVKVVVCVSNNDSDNNRTIFLPDFQSVLANIVKYTVTYKIKNAEISTVSDLIMTKTAGGIYKTNEISFEVGKEYEVTVKGYVESNTSPVVSSTENFTPNAATKVLTIKPVFTQYEAASDFLVKIKFPEYMYSASSKWYALITCGGDTKIGPYKISEYADGYTGSLKPANYSSYLCVFESEDDTTASINAGLLKAVCLNCIITVYDNVKSSSWQLNDGTKSDEWDLSAVDFSYTALSDYFFYVGDAVASVAEVNAFDNVSEAGKTYKKILKFETLGSAINTIQSINNQTSQYTLWINGEYTAAASEYKESLGNGENSLMYLHSDDPLKLSIKGTHKNKSVDIINGNCTTALGNILSINETHTGSQYLISDLTFKNGWVTGSDNWWGRGGAIFSNQNITISNCDFIDNKAYASGGALYFSNGAELNDCVFTGNGISQYAIYGNGSVAYIENCTVSFKNCSMTQNDIDSTAEQGKGVLMLLGSTSKVNFDSCEIKNNKTKTGAFSSQGTIYLKGVNTITDNKITGTETACNIKLESGSKVEITGSLASEGVKSQIGITANASAVFTNNYGKYNSSNLPSEYFISDDDAYKVDVLGAGNSAEGVLQLKAYNGNIAIEQPYDTIVVEPSVTSISSATATTVVMKIKKNGEEVTYDWRTGVHEITVSSRGEDVSSTLTISGNSIAFPAGIPAGENIQIYCSVIYEEKQYGGTFDITVTD